MRRDLARAAATCDWAGLTSLVDRNGKAVRYSFGGPGDPIAYWQEAERAGQEPPPMLALRLLLGLSYAETGAPDHVTYVWPAAFGSEHPTDAQLQEIAGSGLYSLDTLRQWVNSGTNYLGYRVLITAAGDWTAFVAGD